MAEKLIEAEKKVLELPFLCNIPSALYPFLLQFNLFRFFLLWGGRGGAKSQSAARFILYLCEKRKIRVCCGRETQNKIEESVYTLFKNLISEKQLNFSIYKDRIINNKTGSVIIFMGFRESGRVSIKGLEDVDILWIDEAEAITESTLDIVIPTIRKANSKIIFTMNRKTRRDAVFVYCKDKKNALSLKINYYDNPHCPQELIDEALEMKEKDPKKYAHVYEGEPETESDMLLFRYDKLDKIKRIEFPQECVDKFVSMAVDLAGNGGDFCEASFIEQKTMTRFIVSDIVEWKSSDTDYTIGKIINLYRLYEPDLLTLDADGMGYPIYVAVKKAIENCIAFHGAGKSNRENCANQRADGYMTLKEFVDDELLCIPQEKCRSQLEYIEKDYQRNGGKVIIIPKKVLREKYGESPDCADSVMMNVHSINYKRYVAQNFRNNSRERYADNDFSFNDYEIYGDD